MRQKEAPSLREWRRENGIEITDFLILCKSPGVSIPDFLGMVFIYYTYKL